MSDLWRFLRVRAALERAGLDGSTLEREVAFVVTLPQALEMRRQLLVDWPRAVDRPRRDVEEALPEPVAGRMWGTAFGVMVYVLDEQDVAEVARLGGRLSQQDRTGPTLL